MSSDSGEEVSVDMKTGHWTNGLISKLVDVVAQQMRASDYHCPYNEVEINWESVAEEVGTDSEKCQSKWTGMMKYVRMYRTMPEIILDMQTQYSKIPIYKANTSVSKKSVRSKMPNSEQKKSKLKKDTNPDHPKKPLPNGYSLFCQRMYPKLGSVPAINKFLKVGEMWREASADQKAKYTEEHAKQKEEYLVAVIDYAEKHPDDKEIQDILSELQSKKDSKKRPKKPELTKKSMSGDTSNMIDTDDAETSSVASPRKKLKFSPKKVSKKKLTAESVYVKTKIDNYRDEHPDRDEEYLVEKLQRKFAKLSEQKKAKYEAKAREDD